MKPKYGKPLRHLTFRVTQEQYDFLKSRDNASEWLRNAIDARMFEETTDAFAVTRRIEYLERQKVRIYNSEEYKLGKIATKYNDRFLTPDYYHVADKLPISFYYRHEDRKEVNCPIDGAEVRNRVPEGQELITYEDIQNFVEKNDLKVGSFRQIAEQHDWNIMLKFFTYLKEKICYLRAVHKQYTAKLAEIQAEINGLKQKLIEEG